MSQLRFPLLDPVTGLIPDHLLPAIASGGGLTIVDNADGTLSLTPTEPNIGITDDGDGTLTITIAS